MRTMGPVGQGQWPKSKSLAKALTVFFMHLLDLPNVTSASQRIKVELIPNIGVVISVRWKSGR